MPDLLVVVLLPPLLILSTLLLAHVENRVATVRPRPAPPSPGAPLMARAEAELHETRVSIFDAATPPRQLDQDVPGLPT